MQTESRKSKITLFEWKLLQGIAWAVDGVQAFLNAFLIGVIANRFITIFMVLFLLFYFFMRGVRFSLKKLALIIGGSIAEVIPVVDTLPLWAGIIWGMKKWDGI